MDVVNVIISVARGSIGFVIFYGLYVLASSFASEDGQKAAHAGAIIGGAAFSYVVLGILSAYLSRYPVNSLISGGTIGSTTLPQLGSFFKVDPNNIPPDAWNKLNTFQRFAIKPPLLAVQLANNVIKIFGYLVSIAFSAIGAGTADVSGTAGAGGATTAINSIFTGITGVTTTIGGILLTVSAFYDFAEMYRENFGGEFGAMVVPTTILFKYAIAYGIIANEKLVGFLWNVFCSLSAKGYAVAKDAFSAGSVNNVVNLMVQEAKDLPTISCILAGIIEYSVLILMLISTAMALVTIIGLIIRAVAYVISYPIAAVGLASNKLSGFFQSWLKGFIGVSFELMLDTLAVGLATYIGISFMNGAVNQGSTTYLILAMAVTGFGIKAAVDAGSEVSKMLF